MTDPTSPDRSLRGRTAVALRATGRAVARTAVRVRDRARRVHWWRVTGLTALAVVVSVVFGVTTASVDMSLGPHTARYEVTTDATITVDLGPLGTLQIDSPLPLTLGVQATVKEIPDDLTEIDQATTLQALSGDLQTYLAFFTGPQATLTDVARALVIDAVRRSLVMLLLLTAGWWTGRVLLGAARRRELAGALRTHARQLVAGTAVFGVVAAVLTSSADQPAATTGSRPASAVFDGTPLEGARVTGRLGGVIDTYGGYVVDALRTNQEFYDAADAALVEAWDARSAAIAEQEERAAAQESTAQPGGGDGESTEGVQDGAGEGTGDGTGDGAADGQGDTVPPEAALPDTALPDTALPDTTEDAADTPSSEGATPAPEEDGPEPVTVLVVSDLHCNVGMATVIRSLARQSGADLVLDAGDTTMNGTSVEQYCVTTFARAIPSGVPLVVSTGNHDSTETTAMYAKAGATILDGDVVEVEGLRVLGDNDPNETRVGAGGTRSTGESAADAGERLAETACDDEQGVDLLLVHTPAVGDASMDSGCVPAQVSGHFHKRSGPEQVGEGIRYVSSSTAGATLGEATVGPLNGTAELTVLRWDPATRLFLDYQLVSVYTDASVQVTDRLPWPRIVPTVSDELVDPDVPEGVAAGRPGSSPR